MNPPNLYGSKVEEDPHEFIDEVTKITHIMSINPIEIANLATY